MTQQAPEVSTTHWLADSPQSDVLGKPGDTHYMRARRQHEVRGEVPTSVAKVGSIAGHAKQCCLAACDVAASIVQLDRQQQEQLSLVHSAAQAKYQPAAFVQTHKVSLTLTTIRY